MPWKPQLDDFVVSQESAREQVQSLVNHYEIDTTEMLTAEQQNAVGKAITRLVKHYRRGILENSLTEDTLTVIFRPRRAKGELRFREITGKDKVRMDKLQEGDHLEKIYALMASLSGEGVETIKALRSVDIAAVETLGLVFLCA